MKRLLPLCLLLALTTACGSNLYDGLDDADTPEAVQSRIIKDLDEGRFQAVLNNPQAGPLDYSAAAMGLAGLSTTNLLRGVNLITDLQQTGSIEPVAGFSLNPGVLSITDSVSGLDILQEAIARVGSEKTANPSVLADAAFHLVMLALVDVTINFGNGVETIAGAGSTNNGISAAEAETLANQLIQNAISDFTTRVAADITLMNANLADADLGSGSVQTAFSDVVSEISGGDNNVTKQDLERYLCEVLGSGQFQPGVGCN